MTLPLNEDLWVNTILPFVGMGHWAFVAGVNHQMKRNYIAFCNRQKPYVDTPYVRLLPRWGDDVDEQEEEEEQPHAIRLATAVDTFYSAAFSSVACFKFWNNQGHKIKAEVINPSALIALTGNLRVLELAHEEKIPWDSKTCYVAARRGHLEALMYAYENGCPWDRDDMCSLAAHKGHVEILRYVHEHGCPWEEKTCEDAVQGGNFDCLIYMHDYGCPWDEDACRTAASEGQLAILMYAHQNGCPWDADTCSQAACYGYLNVLIYAHENGCPWNESTCRAAAGSLDSTQVCA
jgi:hypothetical protein